MGFMINNYIKKQLKYKKEKIKECIVYKRIS